MDNKTKLEVVAVLRKMNREDLVKHLSSIQAAPNYLLRFLKLLDESQKLVWSIKATELEEFGIKPKDFANFAKDYARLFQQFSHIPR
jgi:hypothetical protein